MRALEHDLNRIQAQYKSHGKVHTISEEKVAALEQTIVDAIKDKRFSLGGAFRKFDTDHSGTIDAAELRTALNEIGVRLTVEEAEGLVAASDSDHNGVLQYDEWIEELRKIRPRTHAGPERGTVFAVADEILAKLYQRHENIEQTFKNIDKDGNGWISKKEFKDFLKMSGVAGSMGPSERDFRGLWKSVDTNGDGRMNWCEWLERMKTVQRDVKAATKYQ